MKRIHQSGGAAIEFALLLPILLAIIFGVVEFSIAFYNKAVLTNASREAARAGVAVTAPKMNSNAIANVAVDYINVNLPLISFSPYPPPTQVFVNDLPTGAAIPSPNSPGGPLSVTVSYSFRGLALGWLMESLGKPITLTATTVMSHE